MMDALVFIGLPLAVFAAAAALVAFVDHRERRAAKGAVYRPLRRPWRG